MILNKKIRIGILGGSFNPPHQGHFYISKIAIKKLKLKQVWWIPTLYNNLKDKNIYLEYDVRIKKCQKIIGNNLTIKIKNNKEIISYKLLSQLKKQYKNYDFTWLMGEDSIIQMHKWQNYKKLIAENKFAVFSRDNYNIICRKSRSAIIAKKNSRSQKYSANKINFITIKKMAISSTLIRRQNIFSNS
jgi:nicotinate-nucleotide adenylyltransferase